VASVIGATLYNFHQLWFDCVCWQKSFYRRLTNEKQSDTFFKVFYERIQDAQQSIKASMSANADESLASTDNIENKDTVKDETKRKGDTLPRHDIVFVICVF